MPNKEISKSTSKTPEEQEELDQALLLQIEKGNLAVLRQLIEKGADVNSVDNKGMTPLHKAAISGNIDAVEMLIASGANIHAADKSGKTPLYYALKNGNVKIAKMLIEKGISMDINNLDMLISSLYRATIEGHSDIARVISSHIGQILSKRSKNEKSPLHKAILEGNIQDVQTLIKEGYDVNAANDLGLSPLFCAIVMGREDIAKYLMQKGADINLKFEGLNIMDVKNDPAFKIGIGDHLKKVDKMTKENDNFKKEKEKIKELVTKIKERQAALLQCKKMKAVLNASDSAERLQKKIDKYNEKQAQLEKTEKEILERIDSLPGGKRELEQLKEHLERKLSSENELSTRDCTKALEDATRKFFDQEQRRAYERIYKMTDELGSEGSNGLSLNMKREPSLRQGRTI